jgi:IclR family KDG regulon transcriptional repressor
MTNQSVWRALTILCLFSRHRTQIGITEVANTLSVTKGAAHGLVATLVRGGFLCQDPETKKYKLGLKIFEVGMMQPQTQHLNQHAMGPTMELSRAHNVVTRVAIWDGDAVLVTWTNYPPDRPELSNSVGPRLHAHSTALGKSVLAHLPGIELDRFLTGSTLAGFTGGTIIDEAMFRKEIEGIRQKGYAFDREESLLGVVCMGAPLFDSSLIVLGAVSLSGPPDFILAKERTDRLAKDLLTTADKISRSLGYPAMFRQIPHSGKESPRVHARVT